MEPPRRVDVLCRELPLYRSLLEKNTFFDRVDSFCSFPKERLLEHSASKAGAFYQGRTEFSTDMFSSIDRQIDSALPSVAVLVQLLV